MLASLVFWPAFAITLPQALWVKSRAPRFGGAPGPRSGRTGPQPAARLVGLGDSIIDGVGCDSLESALIGATAQALARAQGCDVAWRACGQSGLGTRAIRHRLLPEADLDGAEFVLISTGVNDVTALTPIATFRREIRALLAGIRARAPDARIAINSLPPMQCFPALPAPLNRVLGLRARQLDAALAGVVAGLEGVVRVPLGGDLGPDRFAPDGYHPSAASCSELAAHIAEALTAAGACVSRPASVCAGRA